jgi:hypothetical protein
MYLQASPTILPVAGEDDGGLVVSLAVVVS